MGTPLMRKKYLTEFNEKTDFPFSYPSSRSSDCCCKYCERTFSGTQKGLFRQHINTEKHKKNVEQKKKRTATQARLEELIPQETKKSKLDLVSMDLCKMMVASNIPLHKMNNPIFRDFFESHLSMALPGVGTLRTKYLPLCYDEVMKSIKEHLRSGSLWISADCSRNSQHHCGRAQQGHLPPAFPSDSGLSG